MIRFIYGREGLTLMELLIAIIIMMLVVGGTLVVYLMSMTAWKEGTVQMGLQREANIAMEKMVRGVDGKNGIREASSVSTPNSFTIQYTSGVDGKTRRFFLDGTEIKYDLNTPIDEGDDVRIAEDVSGVTFNELVNDSVIEIDLNMLDKAGAKDITVNLYTVVNLRN